MDYRLPIELVEQYHSNSQKSRILTEDWMRNQAFCPICGTSYLRKFENNRPVADFYCPNCSAEFELKSKNGPFTNKVADGALQKMIQRILSNQNPHFFFLEYSNRDWQVHNLTFVPNQFFVPQIIEKRAPLSSSAQRAGWIGCNILYNQIPESGRIRMIREQVAMKKEQMIHEIQRVSFLSSHSLSARGWLSNILYCIDTIQMREFQLSQLYEFLPYLTTIYPNNRHIKAKIRQQLQVLRDHGLLLFCGNGIYQKLY